MKTVSWMINLSHYFKKFFSYFVLHLSVSILHRFLNKEKIDKKCLKLIGSCAILISSKYETRKHIKIKHLIKYGDKDRFHTKEHILRMERIILLALEYDLMFPTTNDFFGHFTDLVFYYHTEDQKIKHFVISKANEIMETLLLFDSSHLFTSSVKASSILLIVLEMFNINIKV